MSTSPATKFITLKHTRYYWIDGERVQFLAETKKESYFTVAVAKFIRPDKSTFEISVTPFTGELVFTEPVTFEVRFGNANWSAKLREAF